MSKTSSIAPSIIGSSGPSEAEPASEHLDGLAALDGDDDDWEDDDDEYYLDVEYDGDREIVQASSEESGNIHVVFENTLTSGSFFEGTRERRRRHLTNRLRGEIPALHFTGSLGTEFWERYGVNPNEVIPPGSTQGVHTMFTEQELK